WITRVQNSQWSDKSVTFAHHGFEKTRVSGIVTQSGADFSHNVVDVGLGIDKQIRTPQFADDLLARNQLFSAAHQKNQEFHRLLFEFDSLTLTTKLVAPQVQFDLAHYRFCASHKALKGHYPVRISNLRRYGKDRQTVAALHWNGPPLETSFPQFDTERRRFDNETILVPDSCSGWSILLGGASIHQHRARQCARKKRIHPGYDFLGGGTARCASCCSVCRARRRPNSLYRRVH